MYGRFKNNERNKEKVISIGGELMIYCSCNKENGIKDCQEKQCEHYIRVEKIRAKERLMEGIEQVIKDYENKIEELRIMEGK